MVTTYKDRFMVCTAKHGHVARTFLYRKTLPRGKEKPFSMNDLQSRVQKNFT
jgi:hypothetical protein